MRLLLLGCPCAELPWCCCPAPPCASKSECPLPHPPCVIPPTPSLHTPSPHVQVAELMEDMTEDEKRSFMDSLNKAEKDVASKGYRIFTEDPEGTGAGRAAASGKPNPKPKGRGRGRGQGEAGGGSSAAAAAGGSPGAPAASPAGPRATPGPGARAGGASPAPPRAEAQAPGEEAGSGVPTGAEEEGVEGDTPAPATPHDLPAGDTQAPTSGGSAVRRRR